MLEKTKRIDSKIIYLLRNFTDLAFDIDRLNIRLALNHIRSPVVLNIRFYCQTLAFVSINGFIGSIKFLTSELRFRHGMS